MGFGKFGSSKHPTAIPIDVSSDHQNKLVPQLGQKLNVVSIPRSPARVKVLVAPLIVTANFGYQAARLKALPVRL